MAKRWISLLKWLLTVYVLVSCQTLFAMNCPATFASKNRSQKMVSSSYFLPDILMPFQTSDSGKSQHIKIKDGVWDYNEEVYINYKRTGVITEEVKNNFDVNTFEYQALRLSERADQQTQRIFHFFEGLEIPFVKGTVRSANGQIQQLEGQHKINNKEYKYFVPDSALVSEKAFLDYIKEQYYIKNPGYRPLDLSQFPQTARTLMENLQERYEIQFYEENNVASNGSYINKEIRIKPRPSEELADLMGTLHHELTHFSSNQHVYKRLPESPEARLKAQQRINGRLMTFYNTKQPAYEKYYRADEIEARVRQIARLRFDGHSYSKVALDLSQRILIDRLNIRTLLKEGQFSLDLGKNVIIVSGPSNLKLEIGLYFPIPETYQGITGAEQYAREVLRAREVRLNHYLKWLDRILVKDKN